MKSDRYRTLTAAAVLLVAGIAAVISYVHISDLSREHGQFPLAAYLMPLSVDGLVAVSSLALIRSARAGITAPKLARSGLILGIGATLGANIASGLPSGWLGAVIAGWPAVAFVISAEIAITMVRRTPATDSLMTAEDRVPVLEASTKTEAIRAAFAELGDGTPAGKVADWLKERGWSVDAAHVRTVRSRARADLNGHETRELAA